MKTVEYKDTEIGRIPEDWSIKQIGKIGYTFSGLTGKGKNDFGKGDARFITFLNVLNNPILRTDIFEKVVVNDGEHQNRAQKGDLFFNTSSETPEEVGICALLNDDVNNLYLNSFCFGFRLTDPDVDGLYLVYYFRSKLGREIMSTLAQGATRYNLSKDYFNKTLIALPPIKQQKKIAQAISEIEVLLAEFNSKIEKKRLVKEGLMQQLLTGKTRLPGYNGEWTEKKISEFGYMVRGVSYSPEDSAIVWKEGYAPLMRSNNIQNGRIVYDDFVFVDRKNISDNQYMNTGDIIICTANGSKHLVGKSAIVTSNKEYTFGAFMGVFRCYDYSYAPFISALFQSSSYRRQLDDILTGSAINNLNASSVEGLKFRMPVNKDELIEIANSISSANIEIQSLEAERDKYILIKQGMMQELLTGKTRLI